MVNRCLSFFLYSCFFFFAALLPHTAAVCLMLEVFFLICSLLGSFGKKLVLLFVSAFSFGFFFFLSVPVLFCDSYVRRHEELCLLCTGV
jgi:hypothetical protein